VGVIAREIEQAGVATASISLVREHTAQVKPPRALFVPYPFGHPLGQAGNPDLQLRVMRAALAQLAADKGPILEDFDDPEFDDSDVELPQASAVARQDHAADPAFEVTSLRAHYEQWLAEHGGRTQVGLSGVDERKFRGLVRFLEALVAGETGADMPERKPEVPLPQFIRWASDDLKAFYFEARMHQNPGAGDHDVNRWFWGETAAGDLLRAVRDRLAADPDMSGAAFGVAR
jgi:hypothetical protein